MHQQVLIKNASLLHPGHPKHLLKTDLLIDNGLIVKIAKNIKADARIVKGKDVYVSSGWTDMRTHLTDPGLEHKDNLASLCETAAAGGFTSICTLPDSLPVIDNKSGIEYLLNRSSRQLTQVLPYGSVSLNMEGQNLAELYDMHIHGAVGFSDGDKSVINGLLRKALLYVKPFDGLIVSFPLDESIHHDGQVNESENTISTGLKVSPSLAEYTCIRQQLDVAEYCDARIHFSGISCLESVELIKNARKKGLRVSCDTTIFNLCFTDKVSEKFDSNFKLMPVLRTEKDRKALLKGVKDGTIDAISSNHHPQNSELKKVEFDYADFGALSHQTFLSMYRMYLSDDLPLEHFIQAVSAGPAKILGTAVGSINEGEPACLTVFDTEEEWLYDKRSNRSSSVNSHLFNQKLRGKVLAVFNNNIVNLYSKD